MRALYLMILIATLTMSCASADDQRAISGKLSLPKNTLLTQQCLNGATWNYRVFENRTHYILHTGNKQPVLIILENAGPIYVLPAKEKKVLLNGPSVRAALFLLVASSLDRATADCLKEIL